MILFYNKQHINTCDIQLETEYSPHLRILHSPPTIVECQYCDRGQEYRYKLHANTIVQRRVVTEVKKNGELFEKGLEGSSAVYL